MGLEELEKQLLADAKKEAELIVLRAAREKEKILEEAFEKKKQILVQAKKSAQDLAEKEKNERISAANLRASQSIEEKKNELVDAGLELVWKDLVAFCETKEYQKFLKKLIAEGEKEIGAQCVVFVSKKDHLAAKKLSENVSKNFAEIAGGAIITTKDEKVLVNNSIEAIFEQNKENIRREIFSELFSPKRDKK